MCVDNVIKTLSEPAFPASFLICPCAKLIITRLPKLVLKQKWIEEITLLIRFTLRPPRSSLTRDEVTVKTWSHFAAGFDKNVLLGCVQMMENFFVALPPSTLSSLFLIFEFTRHNSFLLIAFLFCFCLFLFLLTFLCNMMRWRKLTE